MSWQVHIIAVLILNQFSRKSKTYMNLKMQILVSRGPVRGGQRRAPNEGRLRGRHQAQPHLLLPRRPHRDRRARLRPRGEWVGLKPWKLRASDPGPLVLMCQTANDFSIQPYHSIIVENSVWCRAEASRIDFITQTLQNEFQYNLPVVCERVSSYLVHCYLLTVVALMPSLGFDW